MATINGITAEAMLEIANASVTSGAVDAEGTLILQTRGGTEIEAGDVRGPEGTGPTGTVSMFAGADAPAGWLVCDGSEISRFVFPELFAVIGTAYGAGDGVNTFNLPDLKGRIPVGVDAGQTEFDTLGESGGAKTHTLTANEMPSHTHTQDAHNHTQNSHNHTQNSHTHTQAAHTHTQDMHGHTQPAHDHTAAVSTTGAHTHTTGADTRYGFQTYFPGAAQRARVQVVSTGLAYAITATNSINDVQYSANTDSQGSHTHTVNPAATVATNYGATPLIDSSTATNNSATATNVAATATNNEATAVNQATGGDEAHNNLQPYVVMNYIIKV